MTNTILKPEAAAAHVVPLSSSSSVPQGLQITQDVRLRQTQAEMFTRMQMALVIPRVWEQVQAKLVLSCQNPDFAKVAFYSKPAGGSNNIEGLSIRFAEKALQLMRNISIDTSPEMEDEESVHFRMTITDLESNTPQSETFKVNKTVERRFVKEGDTVLSTRTGSDGHTVYLIPATEDQFNTKLRAHSSKVRRSLILGLVPAEVRVECLALCQKVARDADAKDPAAATKGIIAAFIGIGIDVPDLKEYLGKSPATATAKEVEELRGIFALIRDGELTWSDVMTAHSEREAAKGSKAAFVAEKQKAKEKQRADKKRPAAQRGAATTSAPATAAGTATEPAADKATPPKETPETPRPRANRRGDDEDTGATTSGSQDTAPS